MRIVLIMLALLLLPIVSAVSDTTPPTLVSFDFEPKVVDVTQSDQTIKVTVQLKDDLSGVSNGVRGGYGVLAPNVGFVSPSGKQSASVMFISTSKFLVSGDMLNGTYMDNMTLPQYSENGKWHIDYFYLVDNAGNDKSLNETEIEKLGFPTVIEVKS